MGGLRKLPLHHLGWEWRSSAPTSKWHETAAALLRFLLVLIFPPKGKGKEKGMLGRGQIPMGLLSRLSNCVGMMGKKRKGAGGGGRNSS